MGQAHRQTTQCEQMQRGDQSKGINVEGQAEFGLRPMICWGRHRCLFVDGCRHHKLISFTREARPKIFQREGRAESLVCRDSWVFG